MTTWETKQHLYLACLDTVLSCMHLALSLYNSKILKIKEVEKTPLKIKTCDDKTYVDDVELLSCSLHDFSFGGSDTESDPCEHVQECIPELPLCQ